MIVIGADTHKGSHALAAVDEGTGRARGGREIKADDAGHLAAVLNREGNRGSNDLSHVAQALHLPGLPRRSPGGTAVRSR